MGHLYPRHSTLFTTTALPHLTRFSEHPQSTPKTWIPLSIPPDFPPTRFSELHIASPPAWLTDHTASYHQYLNHRSSRVRQSPDDEQSILLETFSSEPHLLTKEIASTWCYRKLPTCCFPTMQTFKSHVSCWVMKHM